MSKSVIEGLETRVLLSNTLLSNGTLQVTGGNGVDNVAFTLSGSNLQVKENNAVKNYVAAAVKMIHVSGLGGNDVITVADNINVRASIDGGAGDDRITGGANSDTMLGGDGNDSLDGGASSGNDDLFGGAGNDTMIGRSGNDELFGGVGNDSLNAGIGNDTVKGEDGADSVIGDEGRDSIDGGAG